MKRITRTIMLCMVMACILTAPSFATTFTTVQLTTSADRFLINDSGQVVWEVRSGTDVGIFLYDPATGVKQISSNISSNPYAQINNSGQVVWAGWDGTLSQIFLYDPATGVKQISYGSTSVGAPQINDSGQVVWVGWDGTGEIFLYDPATGNTVITPLLRNAGIPLVNDSGQVVWVGWDGTEEIFLYDPATGVKNISMNPLRDGDPQINASGQVVWHANSAPAPSSIFLYDPAKGVTQLTNDSTQSWWCPKINDAGQVLWEGDYGQLFLYDPAKGVTQIANSATGIGDTQINNSGQVVWAGWVWLEGYGWYRDIFFYDPATGIAQLSYDGSGGAWPQLNNSGQVVWAGWYGTTRGLFLSTPSSSGATPPGEGVVTVPADTTSGKTPVTVTFDNVTQGGETTLTTTSTGTPPPAGLKLGTPPTYFDIETTAVYSGNVDICINYSGVSYANENNLRLFHQAPAGTWEDVTTSVDAEKDIVCGEVSSLSPFALFEADFRFAGFFDPIVNGAVNLANAGRTIPVKWQLTDGNGGFISDLSAVTGLNHQQISCQDYGSVIMELEDAAASGDSGLRYDAASNQFVYPWKTDKSMADKCYRLSVELFHLETRTADFEFE